MPFAGHQTWYRIAGGQSSLAPLVLLHGGPGSCHDYFEVLDPLAERLGRQLVTYDQLGCGNSYLDGCPELWKTDLWVRELAALREHLGLARCHLLGQSWGGMLAIQYLIERQPTGVESVILSSTLSSCALWGQEQHARLGVLSAGERAAIARAEASGTYDDPEFRAAEAHFMRIFCSGPYGDDAPECLTRSVRRGRECYLATQGDNELSPTGSFKDWDYTARLGEIGVPTLVVSGESDLCSPRVARTLADGLPNARWELMRGCRHMCFVDDTPGYMALLEEWLDGRE